MCNKTGLEKTNIKQNFIHITVLVITALCIGIYLIATTVIISKDGVTFIEYAKSLDVSAGKAISDNVQHPGYPFMILVLHKMVALAGLGSSRFSWIYSAQITTLLFRLLSIVVLYFIAKRIVSPTHAFWAVLILISLPKPAGYGSDALTDWVSLFFLLTGFLLLIHGSSGSKGWIFGLAGFAAGIGYLVRPEVVQLIIYGFLWSLFQILQPNSIKDKGRVGLRLALLILGFLVMAAPYMKFKGAIFPKKQMGSIVSEIQSERFYEDRKQTFGSLIYKADFIEPEIIKGAGKIVENAGDSLMWFFLPALFIGLYKYFRKEHWLEPSKFYMAVFIILNVSLMVWLHCKYGYMSERHTLPLVVFLIIFVPLGLEISAGWLIHRFTRDARESEKEQRLCFHILIFAGLFLCMPKLFRPIHHDKTAYRITAQWLEENVRQNDVIAVPDVRFAFYSGHSWFKYPETSFYNGIIPSNITYIVIVPGSEKQLPPDSQKVFSVSRPKEKAIAIYKNAQQPF